MFRSRRHVIAASAVSLAMLGACSSGSSPNAPGPASTGAIRTIRITALDALRFRPARVTVKAGERVRFDVTNAGANKHEFIVGGKDVQMQHEQQMGAGASMSSGMQMNLPALTLPAGQTKTATVAFDSPGRLLYGCHQPGHYAAGMVGSIDVT